MTDREYLESVWEGPVPTRKDEYGRWQFFTCNALYLAFFAETEEELYAKGYDFTHTHMEEIRKVREELDVIGGQLVPVGTWDIWQRITAREQAALAALCEGIKPEALK